MKLSNIGDLTPLGKELENIVKKYTHSKDRPTIAICFTLPPNYRDVHWVSNAYRKDAIKLFKTTAGKMKAEGN